MGKFFQIFAFGLPLVAYMYLYIDGFDPKTLQGTRVLITGASSGIGEHLAYEYSKVGARVAITARRKELLDKVAARCRELGAAQVEALPSDLGIEADRKRVVTETKARLGGLDHLVINHAILSIGMWDGTPENMSLFYKTMETNFNSFVHLTSLAMGMVAESKGSIGLVSSMAGKFGWPGLSTYTASKFAMQGFFQALRLEQNMKGTGVSVTLAVIGPVDTDIVPVRLQDPEKYKVMKESLFSRVAVAPPEDAAYAIMRGVTVRAKEIYFPWVSTVFCYINRFAPSLMEYFAELMYYMMNS